MTDPKFTRAEYEDVLRKLHAFREKLSAREWHLLQTVFSAARIHVSLRIPHEAAKELEPTLPGLQQQILDAFIPGEGVDLAVYSRIGGDPMHHPPPHHESS
jgi:hypothetical protein